MLRLPHESSAAALLCTSAQLLAALHLCTLLKFSAATALSDSGSVSGTTKLLVDGAGWALRFDGSNDFVTLGQTMPPPPRTIEFWAWPLELVDGVGDQIVQYNQAGVILSQASMNRGRNLFQINYNGAEVWHTASNIEGVETPEVKPGDQVKYHYAWVEEPGNFSIYINGHLATANTNALKPADLELDFAALPWLLGARTDYIGGDYLIDDRNFGGSLDELRWWSVARTQSEIIECMHKPVPHDAVGLVHQWSFDAGTGLSDGTSYSLGGGDHSRAPAWVPSPFNLWGRPVSALARAKLPQVIQVCGLLQFLPDTAADTIAGTAVFVSAQFLEHPQFGTLNVSIHAQIPMLEATSPTDIIDSTRRHCLTVSYTAIEDEVVFESIPFRLEARLADGGEVSVLQAFQSLDIRVQPNSAPVAGAARALETNGKDNYASLGSWNLADDWSMSVWVYPNAVVDDTAILSRHLSSGGNIFLLMYYGGGYFVRITCSRGCWKDGEERSVTGRLTAPTQADDELVLDTGMTGAEWRGYRSRAQHIAVTFRCLTRGNTATDAEGEVHIYVDGMLIGHDMMPACFTHPLDPHAYGNQPYVAARPAPWEVGSEYDGGVLDEHLLNVNVKPSNFFNGIFDEVLMWNRTLTAAEVASSAEGAIPHSPVVHFSFDADDSEDCLERQLWEPAFLCHPLNDAEGHAMPAFPFPWTNSPINGAQHVRSPFSKVKGGDIHVSMEVGSCRSTSLIASEPDGDAVTFTLVAQEVPAGMELVGATLTLCDSGVGRRDVEVSFDACDSYGLCSSAVSGLGRVVFHILERGPEIMRFQALPWDASFRIAFSEATNEPRVDTETDIVKLLEFEPPIAMVLGAWEPGGQYLVVYPQPTSIDDIFYTTNCSESPSTSGNCAWSPPRVTVRVLWSGLLRDKNGLKYPSAATSSPLVDATCASGTVFFPGELDCQPCQPGEVVTELGAEVSCQPCSPGTYELASMCERCEPGRFSDAPRATACVRCPIIGSTSSSGSWDVTGCFCPADTYEEAVWVNDSILTREGARCLPCPGGMTCAQDSREANLNRNITAASGNAPVLNENFMSQIDAPLRVYLCRSLDHCPGGSPGVCGEHRDAATVACALCEEGYTIQLDGGCALCEVTYSIWLPLSFFVVLSPILLYIASEYIYQPRLRESTSSIGPAMVAGVLITTLQTLAVFHNITLDWKEPVKSILSSMQLAEFDVDIFGTGCFAGRNPLSKFVLSQAIAPSIAVALSAVFAIKKMIFRRVLDLEVAICNGVGAVYLVFFTTIVLSAVKPFVCYKHPSGGASMYSAPSVLCFDDSEHNALIGVSVLTLVLFVSPFVAWVCWGSVRFPLYVSNRGFSGHRGLERFNFLYRRFHPWAYYFSAVHLLRALGICLVPVVIRDEPGIHALLLSVMLMGYTILVSSLTPWRLPLANAVDNFMSGLMVLMLLVGSLTAKTHVDTTMLQFVSFILLCLAMTGLGVSLLVATYRRFKPGPHFHSYICHHRAAAAAQVRHLKMLLEGDSKRRCFISSDHLKVLDTAFDIVRTSLSLLVVYLTKDTLRRSWCAGEVTTAFMSAVETVVVKTSEFSPMEATDLENPLKRYVVPPLEGLMAAGVTTRAVSAAYGRLLSGTAKVVHPDEDLQLGHRMQDVAAAILGDPSLRPQAPDEARANHIYAGSLLLSSNPTEPEATATANILVLMLQEVADEVLAHGAHLLCDSDLDIQAVEPSSVLVILTAGSLISMDQIAVVVACAGVAPVLPINVGLFSYPSKEYYQCHLPHMLAACRLDVEGGSAAMRAFLNKVMLPLTPGGSSSKIRNEAKSIAELIHKVQRGRSFTDRSEDRESRSHPTTPRRSPLSKQETSQNLAEFYNMEVSVRNPSKTSLHTRHSRHRATVMQHSVGTQAPEQEAEEEEAQDGDHTWELDA